MKISIKNALDQSFETLYNRYLRDKRNTDIVMSQALKELENNHHQQVGFPSAYVEVLRSCIETKRLQVKTIKKTGSLKKSIDKIYLKQFLTLINVLRQNVLPIEINTAKEIALIADSFRSTSKTYQESNWVGDVHTHFQNSSSFGEKGRILNTAIRIMLPQQCLELGTAYGMSALFIMEALKSIGDLGQLITVEGGELQYNLSSKILQEKYGDRINCHLGMTQDLLPELVKSVAKIDFIFHDAGHRKENYIRDFNTLLPVLKPGSVFLIDDIYWEDTLFSFGEARCYEGWTEIINHPRVIYAVEINKDLGMALID
ncbi:Methyltransferase domain-containing protein [Hyella patelloides LEGE 07179]|uniref:Methyltransferase domain-containing protein n=1 Tax=Hyella patelloides LEGE 07179 TaxID=945734 RepID=A0A563W442_9CYAN|nr:class I SAM-dependent methyltransferase [Hyella patelloides]VEP18407.1 Methyltransferase domain-containing protein [Hyella patelloides LEGE 07179]